MNSTVLTAPVLAGAARQPRLIHACILLLTASLTVMVAALIGPTLPKMQQHFASVSNVDFLVPLSMTGPMAAMALFCIVFGALADRVGRKRLLVGSTALYAVFGTMPLYLDSLHAIMASRFSLGIMEAALMTVSTAMIGDYYSGAKRDRYIALQTTVAAISVFLFNILGGIIGEFGWRAPYYVFFIGLLMAPLMAIYLWEPTHHDGEAVTMTRDPDGVTWRPRLLARICFIAVLVGLVFLIVPVHLGFLFGTIGVQSSTQIGIAYSLNSVGFILGTLTVGWILRRFALNRLLCFAALITGISFMGMNYAGDYWTLTIAGMFNGFGTGLLLTSTVIWNMRELPLARRGLGVGAYQSCLYFGMFINPVVVVGLEKVLGQRADAIGYIGGAVLVAAVLALFAVPKRHANETAGRSQLRSRQKIT